jgi:hypothetical protein
MQARGPGQVPRRLAFRADSAAGRRNAAAGGAEPAERVPLRQPEQLP